MAWHRRLWCHRVCRRVSVFTARTLLDSASQRIRQNGMPAPSIYPDAICMRTCKQTRARKRRRRCRRHHRHRSYADVLFVVSTLYCIHNTIEMQNLSAIHPKQHLLSISCASCRASAMCCVWGCFRAQLLLRVYHHIESHKYKQTHHPHHRRTNNMKSSDALTLHNTDGSPPPHKQYSHGYSPETAGRATRHRNNKPEKHVPGWNVPHLLLLMHSGVCNTTKIHNVANTRRMRMMMMMMVTLQYIIIYMHCHAICMHFAHIRGRVLWRKTLTRKHPAEQWSVCVCVLRAHVRLFDFGYMIVWIYVRNIGFVTEYANARCWFEFWREQYLMCWIWKSIYPKKCSLFYEFCHI